MGESPLVDTHLVREGARFVPAAESEFARDPTFGYRAATLPEWVEEKTAGRWVAGKVARVTLDDIRVGGEERVAAILDDVQGGQPVVVNALDYPDLWTLVLALEQVESAGKVFVYRTQDAGLIQRDDAMVERLKECQGCTILGEDWAGFDTTTTPKMTASVTSILDRFGDDLEYIVTPYSVADYFAVQALEARGRSDVKIISNSPYPDQVQACANGEYIGAAMGDDLNWVGWEAVDLLSRVLEDPSKPLPDENTVWVLLTKDSCPASGNLSEDNPVDFRAMYRELWGLS